MRILVESMYDVSIKDNDKILWNSTPDIDKRNNFVENLLVTFMDSIKCPNSYNRTF